MENSQKQTLMELLEQREIMYRTLARIYKTEADEALIKGLAKAEFPKSGEGKVVEGYQLIAEWLKGPGTDDPTTTLAVDYAHTFLGAGIAEGRVSYPFESVYTSPQRLVMQDAWEDVCRIYREHGLGRASTMDMHEDQIGLECEFMAHLVRASMNALKADDEEALEKTFDEQLAFLEKHLLNWVPAFCADVCATALTDFYRGFAMVTEDYIAMDHQFVTDLRRMA